MKKLVFPTFITGLFILLSTSFVFAQTPTTQTQFPFIINGQTCETKEECRVLCNDPVNRAACRKLNPNPSPKVDRFLDPSFVENITATLGCSTAETCKALCNIPANFEKCDSFAQSNQLQGGYDRRIRALSELTANTEISDQEVAFIQELQTSLSNSGQTLKEYCDLPEHQAACTFIAKKLGLAGGEKLEGPGGCESSDTCRMYCDDPKHFAECKRYEIVGINDCASELACYNEVQSKANLLTTLFTDDEEVASEAGNPVKTDEINLACASATEGYAGQSVSELANDITKSGVCSILPKTGVPGKNSNCDAYLSSGQPFDQAIFDKICSITPVVASGELNEVNTETASTDLTSYGNWCQNLPSVGQSDSSDWQVVPSLCQNFVKSFQEARVECAKPAEDRAEWLSDPIAYSRYCLSAPKQTADYVQACKSNPTECNEGGFDWYCELAGSECIPLYQGRPLDQTVETFADAGVVKDGDQVSLVLDETTQDFAENVLDEVITESGATSTFRIVDQLPEQLSPNAVFVSGTGVSQPNGDRSRTFFQPNIIANRVSNAVSPFLSGQPTIIPDQIRVAFNQPWFAIDAYQKDPAQLSQSPVNPFITQPIGPNAKAENKTGWGVVKQNEQKIREAVILKTEENTNSGGDRTGFLLPPKDEIKVDTNLFKPQILVPQSTEQFRVQPTEPLRKLEPTGIRSGTSTETKPSPTRSIEVKPTQSTGTTSFPTTPPRFEPTKPPPEVPIVEPTRAPVIEPTKPPENRETTQTSTTTTTSSTTGGTSTTTTTNLETRVQGVYTERKFWELTLELRKQLLGF